MHQITKNHTNMSTQAAKRRRTTAASKAEDSTRLQLSKNIASLVAGMEKFTEGVGQLAAFNEETIRDFDMQLDAKKVEFEELEHQFAVELKNKQIETDQTVKEYGYEAAKKTLADRGEVPVASAELEQLRAKVAAADEAQQQAVAGAVAKEKGDAKRGIEAAVNNCKLTHKAELAGLTAAVEQKEHEIKSLRGQMDDYKEQVVRLNETIKEVAASSSKAVTQNIGK